MIQLGKEKGLKDLLEGREKISKDEAVETSPLTIDGIVKGVSKEGDTFVYLLVNEDKFVPVPSANLETFVAYADDPKDKADLESGKYVVFFEKHVSKANRDYFTCYLDAVTD